MKQVPVKLYGLFGKFHPVEYDVDEDVVSQLGVESLLDIDNNCYEICSLFRSGSYLLINLRLLPNPQLYEPRPRWTLPGKIAS